MRTDLRHLEDLQDHGAPRARSGAFVPRSRRRARRRGFTMLEILVTGAIISMFLAIAGMQAVKIFQRNKLLVSAQEIEQLAQRAFIEMQRRSRPVFLYLDVQSADGTIPLMLVEDTDRNGSPDPGGADAIITTYVIQTSSATVDRDVSLSTTSYDQIQSTNWSQDATATTTERWLRVDSVGRTSNVVGLSTQIPGTATLAITHPRMLGGASAPLQPLVNYELHISPVWNAKFQRPIL